MNSTMQRKQDDIMRKTLKQTGSESAGKIGLYRVFQTAPSIKHGYEIQVMLNRYTLIPRFNALAFGDDKSYKLLLVSVNDSPCEGKP